MSLDFIQIYSVVIFALLVVSGVSEFKTSDDRTKKIAVVVFVLLMLVPTYGRVWGFW